MARKIIVPGIAKTIKRMVAKNRFKLLFMIIIVFGI
jgi:hypothetical protein